MSDIEENIEDTDMDDFDGNRTKKIREYSFSPTKTPSKRGRDALNERKYQNYASKSSKPPIPLPNNKKWMEKNGYFSMKEFKDAKRNPVGSIKYDIENFRMIDQPNYDGNDKNITLWCTCNPDVKHYLCESSRKWIDILKSHQFHYQKWKSSYQNLLRDQEQSKQISRDIERTFQKHYAFRHTSMIHKLSRVLNAIALYDSKLGYVQGMNFVAGAILIHCEESIAFWLFIELLENYEMREVYDDGLIGMYRHSAILEKFISKYMPEINDHFEEVDVKVEMFMSDWVISFLCSYIPLSRLNTFLTAFFQRGWLAFH